MVKDVFLDSEKITPPGILRLSYRKFTLREVKMSAFTRIHQEPTI